VPLGTNDFLAQGFNPGKRKENFSNAVGMADIILAEIK